MTIEAKVIADSISPVGKRLTTLQLVYPRFIHAEFMTHRVFSRNASSSRAIPVARMIQQVWNNPAMPIHWGKNQARMQAKKELIGEDLECTQASWMGAARDATRHATWMMLVGAHKQIVNRILEPFQHIHVVVTATEWDNFFELRLHEDAQPEIHELARVMKEAMDASTPVLLQPGEWHLPYVTVEDTGAFGAISGYLNCRDIKQWRDSADKVWAVARQVSAARCCRVSYLKHDGTNSTIEEDLALCERLAGARPIHASPFEHQATPDMMVPDIDCGAHWQRSDLHGNFVGWVQHRKLIEQGHRHG